MFFVFTSRQLLYRLPQQLMKRFLRRLAGPE
jgi:hypothetical protein